MLNNQRPEPYDDSTGEEIDLHTIWHTIQGEGIFAGRPAFFIRLAGCNLQCPGCDTEYTKNRRRVHVNYILRAIKDLKVQHPNTTLVVITGGEPTRQNLDQLIYVLTNEQFLVQIESNGVLPPSYYVLKSIINEDVVYCVSPKTSKICAETKFATYFKYVVSSDNISSTDGLPIKALGHTAKPHVARPPAEFEGVIYINPANEHDNDKNFQNLMAARDSAMRHGHTLGIQLHLLLNLP